jgi:hypothetical protein
MVTPKGSISIGRESHHVFLCSRLRGVLADFTAREQSWRNIAWTGNKKAFCVLKFSKTESIETDVSDRVRSPKPPLHRHNWLSFGEFQDTERFLIPCSRHVSSQLPPSVETCKYATAPSTQKHLERFSIYWYAPLRRDLPGYCTAEVGNPRGTYELPCM